MITERAAQIREQLKKKISNIFRQYGGAVSLDEWTDKCRKMSYFGLTLHYIEEVDGQLVLNNRVMLIRQLIAEKKDAAFLRSKILEYMIEFDLVAYVENKIVFISDRGPSLAAACRAFQSGHCLAHLIHNVVEKMLEKNTTVAAVTAIVKYFKSSGLNVIFEQTLKSYVSTRWNTVYRMLESVIAHWDEIVHELRTRNKHLNDLNSISLEELKIIRDFLKPFAQAILEAEVTKTPTIDIVHPWFVKLLNHMKCSRTDPNVIVNLKTIGYSYWKSSVETNITLWHSVAVFLNPLMKSLKTFTEVQRNRIYARVSELMDNFMPENNLTQDDRERANDGNNVHLSEAMDEFLDNSDDTLAQSDTSELEEYKTMRVSGFETSLQWWQRNKIKFPRLYGVARFIFAIPASSAASERLFSIAGRLVHFRPNLRAEMVDEILFLKSNLDLFEVSECETAIENEDYVDLVHEPEDEGVVLVGEASDENQYFD